MELPAVWELLGMDSEGLKELPEPAEPDQQRIMCHTQRFPYLLMRHSQSLVYGLQAAQRAPDHLKRLWVPQRRHRLVNL